MGEISRGGISERDLEEAYGRGIGAEGSGRRISKGDLREGSGRVLGEGSERGT